MLLPTRRQAQKITVLARVSHSPPRSCKPPPSPVSLERIKPPPTTFVNFLAKPPWSAYTNEYGTTYSPEQAPPAKASIFALDILAFTGGACSVEYDVYGIRVWYHMLQPITYSIDTKLKPIKN